MTLEDYHAFVPGDDICRDEYVGELRRVRQGDACDPIACDETRAELGPVDPALAPPYVCLGPGYMPATCEYRMPSTVVLAAAGASVPAQGKTGARYCKCLFPHATEGERRLNCGDSFLGANCDVDVQRYTPMVPDTYWKPMSLGGQPPSISFELDVSFGPNAPEVSTSWDALADLLLHNTGAPLPPPPWTKSDFTSDGELVGGPFLRGIVWSHVPFLDGQPTKDMVPAPGFRPIAPLANNYRPADLRFVVEVVGGSEMPVEGPAFPWTYCAECMLGPEMQWLWVIDAIAPGRVVSIGPTRVLEVSSAVTDVARSLLASGHRRVPASEPDHRLTQAGLTRREVLLDASSPELPVLGALGVRQGKVVGAIRDARASVSGPDAAFTAEAGMPPAGTEADPMMAAGADDEAAGPALRFAYSAIRNEVFALLADGPGAEVRLHRWSAEAGIWTQVALHGASMGSPVDLVFHLEEGALYALDMLPETPEVTRLVRIDLFSGDVSVVAASLLVGPYGARSLGIAHRGGLLLAATRTGAPGRVQLAHLEIHGSSARVVDTFEQDGSHAGTARENAYGVHYLVPTSGGFAPHRVSPASFSAVDSSHLDPVFP